ncbi:MAG: M15 family metallopeptidase, partial [Ruminococcus sp.]|nr:M15 family metallopeptidase [Ruminococcus sp.]
HYEGDVLIVNKTYSIPASYNPGALDPTCNEWFNKLVQGASRDGINIFLSSGFRSYGYQEGLYNTYAANDGVAKADTYSARPGHSEHQTGLAIDVNEVSDLFIGTPEAQWIEDHCWEYGFILRYPKGKQDITGYKYEPWHIRYVGYDMSKKIHDRGGITLEEYFGLTSQYQS